MPDPGGKDPDTSIDSGVSTVNDGLDMLVMCTTYEGAV